MTLDLKHKQLQHRLGYVFKDDNLLLQALTHRSFSKAHNERLEFLGDALVGCLVADMLYATHVNKPEGELTAMRSVLVCKQGLSEVAKELELGEHLRLGESTIKTGGHRLQSILADALEALVAAVYLDGGFAEASKLATQVFANRIKKLGSIETVRDAKSRLQELLQADKCPLPEYQLVDVTGPGHQQGFHIHCRLDGVEQLFAGKASNRRAAEQMAASKALDFLQLRAKKVAKGEP